MPALCLSQLTITPHFGIDLGLGVEDSLESEALMLITCGKVILELRSCVSLWTSETWLDVYSPLGDTLVLPSAVSRRAGWHASKATSSERFALNALEVSCSEFAKGSSVLSSTMSSSWIASGFIKLHRLSAGFSGVTTSWTCFFAFFWGCPLHNRI